MRIKDIAREAGVSTATVSHVINKTKYVSDPTRDKVEAAIKKFGYHPNAHAQMLALGKSKIIGLLVSDISNPFFPEIIKSVEAAVIAALAAGRNAAPGGYLNGKWDGLIFDHRYPGDAKGSADNTRSVTDDPS